MKRISIAVVLSLAGAMGSIAQTPRRLPTLFIIGDSIVNNGTKGLQGWGTPIAEFFDTKRLKIENRARGGRSSRTFLTEGLWQQVVDQLQPGDFVLMQFGHNDGGAVNDASRARGSLKGNGEETEEMTTCSPNSTKSCIASAGISVATSPTRTRRVRRRLMQRDFHNHKHRWKNWPQ